MRRMEIVSGGTIFRNPSPGHRVDNAYLPCIQQLASGELFCVYRRGTTFYSIDGVLVHSRSADGGETWQEEGLVWAPRADGRPYTYSAPFLAELSGSNLVLAAFRADCSNPDRLLVNPQTGSFVPVETLLFRSTDNGYHWSPPPDHCPSRRYDCLSGGPSCGTSERSLVSSL